MQHTLYTYTFAVWNADPGNETHITMFPMLVDRIDSLLYLIVCLRLGVFFFFRCLCCFIGIIEQHSAVHIASSYYTTNFFPRTFSAVFNAVQTITNHQEFKTTNKQTKQSSRRSKGTINSKKTVPWQKRIQFQSTWVFVYDRRYRTKIIRNQKDQLQNEKENAWLYSN